MNVREYWNYRQISASGVLMQGNGQTAGVLCTTNGTIAISEGPTAGGSTIIATISLTSGQWIPLPFKYISGCYVTVGGGGVFTFATA